VLLAFLSYESLIGSGAAEPGNGDTPGFVLLRPCLLVEVNHESGRAILSGDYRATAAKLAEALSKGQSGAASSVHDQMPAESLAQWRQTPSDSDFNRAAEAVQEQLRHRDDVLGVCLSVELETTSDIDPLAAYKVLRKINPSTCMFFMERPDFALWGSTSLPVLKVRGRQLVAETDGATRKVDPNGSADWIPTGKENEEYDLVVAALLDDLEGVVIPESLTFIADREPRQYFNLQHLFAELSGQLATGMDAIEALKRLTPHGAATGYQKPATVELIKQFDVTPRGPYAGAIGVFRVDGDADAACVIRSAWKVGSRVRTRAGAKIVAGSDPSAECRESVLKTLPLRRALAEAAARKPNEST
jgi:anthranilate synthase component 1